MERFGDRNEKTISFASKAHTQHRPVHNKVRQEMLKARREGGESQRMPEQPTELEENEFKLALIPLRRHVSFMLQRNGTERYY